MRIDERRLAALEAELARLKGEIASVGFVSPGSVVRRFMPCGKPGCRCQGDPPQLHGPYWQWSHKVGGKTATRRLTEDQARLYQQWIANRHRLGELLVRMEQVSSQAATILLRNASAPSTRSKTEETTSRTR
ncbi:MAG TPA: DUF6788 family protein [Streptosporangiaceae bacterium]